jgi:hypothetical protein
MTRAKSKVTNGSLLFAIGLLHNLFVGTIGIGLPGIGPRTLAGRHLFAEMLSDGLIGSIGSDPWRSTVFWSLMFGGMTMILGWCIHGLERAGHPLPRALAWQVGVLTLAGGLLMTVSGFWLGLVVAVRLGLRGRGGTTLHSTVPAEVQP